MKWHAIPYNTIEYNSITLWGLFLAQACILDCFAFLCPVWQKWKWNCTIKGQEPQNTSVVLWSSRHHHQLHPALDWLSGELSLPKIIMLFTKSVYLCLCRLVPEIQVWKHVRLLVLAALAGLGGLGTLGQLGAPIFFPNIHEDRRIFAFVGYLVWFLE